MEENDLKVAGGGIPSVMKAAQQINSGNVRDVLTLRDDVVVPRQLSPKQVLVRVHAASINASDWKILYGHVALVIRFTFPHIPGSDIAGVIVDVGSDVQRFRVGDQVYGNLGIYGGGYAEYTRANESMLALKPSNLSMEEAAAVPLACETSYGVLFRKLVPPVGNGSKVFICGGSSATGFYAIQLAKAVGATVATACSQRNFPLIEQLGYKIVRNKSDLTNDENELLVVDYNEKDFGDEFKGDNYDVVYDCVGGQQHWISAQHILKRGGQFVTIVGDDSQATLSIKWIFNTLSGIINRKFWSLFSSAHHSYTLHSHSQTPGVLDDIRTNYIENGRVKPLIDTIYDWKKDGVEALYSLYERLKSGKISGKLVVKISDEK